METYLSSSFYPSGIGLYIYIFQRSYLSFPNIRCNVQLSIQRRAQCSAGRKRVGNACDYVRMILVAGMTHMKPNRAEDHRWSW